MWIVSTTSTARARCKLTIEAHTTASPFSYDLHLKMVPLIRQILRNYLHMYAVSNMHAAWHKSVSDLGVLAQIMVHFLA